MATGEAYDSPKAKVQAGPSAVMILHDLVEAGAHRPLGYRVPEGIRALRDAGFAQFAAHIRYGQDTMLEEWADVFSGV